MSEEENKKKCIGICIGGSCYNAGAEQVMEAASHHYGVEAGGSNDKIELDYTSCLGHCEMSVNLERDGDVITHVSPENVVETIETGKNADHKDLPPQDDLAALLEKEITDL